MKGIAEIRYGSHLSDMFPARNGWTHDVLSPLLVNFALEYAIRRSQVIQDGLKSKWYTPAFDLC